MVVQAPWLACCQGWRRSSCLERDINWVLALKRAEGEKNKIQPKEKKRERKKGRKKDRHPYRKQYMRHRTIKIRGREQNKIRRNGASECKGEKKGGRPIGS